MDFPKIGDGFPLKSVIDFPQKPNQFIAQSRSQFCLLEQGQSFPKTYYLLLFQFGISIYSPTG